MRWIVIVIIVLGLSVKGSAQQYADSTELWEISTTDGNTFQGFILAQDDFKMVFKSLTYGEITLPKLMIVRQKNITPSKKIKHKAKNKILKDSSINVSKDTKWRIVTDDGFDFVGTVLSKNDQEIELSTIKYGVVKIQRKLIKNMIIITDDQIIGGDVWFENPQGSRYFYCPNGYGLRKNEGYYQNVWVMFNQASYGFNNYFTMGIGTIPTVLFGADFLPVWITPKASIPVVKDKFNVGGGIFLGSIIGEGVGFGVAYGVATIGNRDKNINLGMGYFFADGEWANRPTFTISTMLRTGKKGYFISENYFINTPEETFGIILVGGRTIWPRLSLDYGLIVPINMGLDTFIAIPWLGFVIPFGNYQQATY